MITIDMFKAFLHDRGFRQNWDTARCQYDYHDLSVIIYEKQIVILRETHATIYDITSSNGVNCIAAKSDLEAILNSYFGDFESVLKEALESYDVR